MVILLTDGGSIQPKGEITQGPLGITIINSFGKNTIPMHQIKWIFDGDSKQEEVFLKFAKTKKFKPLENFIEKDNNELMRKLYK